MLNLIFISRRSLLPIFPNDVQDATKLAPKQYFNWGKTMWRFAGPPNMTNNRGLSLMLGLADATEGLDDLSNRGELHDCASSPLF